MAIACCTFAPHLHAYHDFQVLVQFSHMRQKRFSGLGVYDRACLLALLVVILYVQLLCVFVFVCIICFIYCIVSCLESFM